MCFLVFMTKILTYKPEYLRPFFKMTFILLSTTNINGGLLISSQLSRDRKEGIMNELYISHSQRKCIARIKNIK